MSFYYITPLNFFVDPKRQKPNGDKKNRHSVFGLLPLNAMGEIAIFLEDALFSHWRFYHFPKCA